ncbi:hypothetical protein T06_4150, partial [Trichinella sp. T6]
MASKVAMCLFQAAEIVQYFWQYLGKYAFVKRETRFCKVLRHINAYVSNKWPLKFPCAYLNTQESSRN